MELSNRKLASSPLPRRRWAAWLKSFVVADRCAWGTSRLALHGSPLGVLILSAIASLLCGLFVVPQAYVFFVALLAVVGIGLVWPWVAIQGVKCEVSFSASRGREGEACSVHATITNRWPWPVWGLRLEGGGFEFGEFGLARVGGWAQTRYRWKYTPRQRGVLPSGDMVLVTEFPFGLWSAKRLVHTSGTLTVWPHTFWLPPLQSETRRINRWGNPSDSKTGFEGARLTTREFRRGDRLRDIHWANTARYDRLIVSEREGAGNFEAVVHVDVAADHHQGVGPDSTLEWSLRIAASICESVVSNHGSVVLWLGANCKSARSTRGELDRLLDWIAMFDSKDVESANTHLNRPGRQIPELALYVVTDLGPASGDREIVLRTRGFASNAPELHPERRGWILVDSPDDVATQVLNGWRAVTRGGRYVG